MAKKQRKFRWFADDAEAHLSDDRYLALSFAASGVAGVLRRYAWCKTDSPGVFVKQGRAMTIDDLVTAARRYRNVKSRRSVVRASLYDVIKEAVILNTNEHPLEHQSAAVYYMPEVVELFQDSQDRARKARGETEQGGDNPGDHAGDNPGDHTSDDPAPHSTEQNSTEQNSTGPDEQDGRDGTGQDSTKQASEESADGAPGLGGPGASAPSDAREIAKKQFGW